MSAITRSGTGKFAGIAAISPDNVTKALAAAAITLLLTSLIVGIETVSSTGQLDFKTRFAEVINAAIGVFFGSLAIAQTRQERPMFALVAGGLAVVGMITILVLLNPAESRIQIVLVAVAMVQFGLLTSLFARGRYRSVQILAGACVPLVLALLVNGVALRNESLMIAIGLATFCLMAISILRAGNAAASLVVAGGAVVWLALCFVFGDAADTWRHLTPFASPIVNWGTLLIPLSIFGRAVLVAKWRSDRQTGKVSAGQTAAEAVQQAMPWVGFVLIVVALVLPWLPIGDRTMEKKIIDICTIVLTYIMLGWGLNIVVGLAGLLDLGYVAFYAVGAYTYAMLSVYLGWSFWVCLPLAGLLAATFGVLLGFPVLRLRGDYLAIVTLGFGEMIRIIIVNWRSLTGGPNGINKVPRASFFGLPMDRNVPEGVTSFHKFFGLEYNPNHRVIFLYYLVLAAALVVNFFTLRIRKLPLGRAWEALREDETACRALGINPTNTKLTAFAVGAMFGGFAGSFFAVRNAFISPESFVFLESAIILAIVVLGGLGSQVGIVLAAAVLIGLPEMFRELSEYRMLAFGIGMVLIMVWRPGGLLAHREPTIRLHPAGGPPPDIKKK